jgi:methanogenic corrinoid protein MtbC1
MYSIKQASIRSGVSVPLIRAWERRYGVVSPKRTASGYRLYDDEAIATLLRVKDLTDNGWSASEASRAILAGEILVTREPVRTGPPDGSSHARHAELIERFIASATVVDSSATSAVLDEMFALGSFESIVDDLIMPALVALGRAWSEGTLDVAAEHAASAAAYRRLSALYEAAAVIGETSVVVGLPPGARHELGALAFSVALRRLGVGVLYVGADLPVTSWVHVLMQERARLAVVAIVQASDRAAGLAVARALRAADGGLVLAMGGGASRWEGAREAGIVSLPDRITEAAQLTARLVMGTIGTREVKGAGT